MLAASGLLILAACASPPPAEPKGDMLAAPEEIASFNPPPAPQDPPPVPLDVAAERCREAQARGTPPLSPPSPRGLTPLVRDAPPYPLRGLAAEVEGRCDMTFDVAADGLVVPDSIVAECSSEIFVEVSIRAVERWCFAPAAADGDPGGWPGVRGPLRFDLSEEAPVTPAPSKTP
jgi:outer membrane biosynthesis protein TonB